MNTQYKFQEDWFSGNIPVFEKILTSYIDKPCHFLEIGTHEGRATTWLLDNILSHPLARIDTIDPRPQDVLFENLEKTGNQHKATIHKDTSLDALRKLPLNNFDFIYIDGSHNVINVIEDAVLSFPLLKTGGIMAFDDYLWNDPKYSDGTYPKPAIDAFLDLYKHKINLLYKDYQVWVQKKSGKYGTDHVL